MRMICAVTIFARPHFQRNVAFYITAGKSMGAFVAKLVAWLKSNFDTIMSYCVCGVSRRFGFYE